MNEIRKMLDGYAVLRPRASDGISVDANHHAAVSA
jgi:hypothetical protein